MPKCLPCLSPTAKQVLQDSFPTIGPVLQAIPNCKGSQVINMCGGAGGARGPRGKRAPSAYNFYISTCMKAQNIRDFGQARVAMKSCAEQWRRRK